ncbi:MAG: SWIB/MDM2 domain-containing protein [Gemmatimonadaceae bacterium]
MATAKKKSSAKTSSSKSTAKKSTASKSTAKKSSAAKKAPAKKSATKRAPSAAFMKPMTPSAELAAVVGSAPLPRTEVTKKLWAYIKRKGLQDSKNKRMINADDSLRPVFNGTKQVSMFEMTRLVNKHLK